MTRFPALLVLVLPLAAQWPQFRGPNGSGLSDSAALPVRFGPGRGQAWRTELPPGHSSPVIAGDRIYVTGVQGGRRKAAGPGRVVDEGGRLFTICLDRASGKVLWRREAPRPRLESYQPTNSSASPSPAADASGVYVFFGDFGMLAYGPDGNERWGLPLGPFNNPNGHGSSPVLVDGLVVLLCDQDTDSYIIAADQRTGQVKWKTPRPDSTRSYSTPAILRPTKGNPEVVVPGSYHLTSYDARTGERLWWINGMSWQPKSTPVIDGDTIYAHWWENGGEAEAPTVTPDFAEIRGKFDANHDGRISFAEFASDTRLQKQFADNDLNHDGYVDEREWNAYRARRSSRDALLAVRHGARGDLTGSPSILWRVQKNLPNVPSPLLYRGVIYLVKNGGILTSLDAKSGRVLKQGRLPGALDTYYSSPVAGAGHIYLLSQSGKLTVLRAGGEWEPEALNDFDEECFATPAIAGDTIYVRTHSALHAFRAPRP